MSARGMISPKAWQLAKQSTDENANGSVGTGTFLPWQIIVTLVSQHRRDDNDARYSRREQGSERPVEPGSQLFFDRIDAKASVVLAVNIECWRY